MKHNVNLPDEVKRFTYVKNHHWIELEDTQGNVTKLTPTALMMGKCKVCTEVNIALYRMGEMRCTYCGSEVEWAWSRPQLAFVPEKESDFMPPPQAAVKDPKE